jgi:hypothetical protein
LLAVENSIYYNEALDQIMLSVRGNSEVWVIDHGTTTTEAAGHAGGRYGKGGDLTDSVSCPNRRGPAGGGQLKRAPAVPDPDDVTPL